MLSGLLFHTSGTPDVLGFQPSRRQPDFLRQIALVMGNRFQGLYAARRWPVTIYLDWLRIGLTFLVPVAFAVTVPAEALTLLGALGLAVLLMALVRFVWRLSVRSYSGASA